MESEVRFLVDRLIYFKPFLEYRPRVEIKLDVGKAILTNLPFTLWTTVTLSSEARLLVALQRHMCEMCEPMISSVLLLI